MSQHLFTVLSILVILLAVLVALVQPVIALVMIGGVLLSAICLLVYRLMTRG